MLPPLRERVEDIRLLVDHMIEKYASERRPGQQVTGVDQEVDRLLYGYSWPGNVRELENAIERAMVLCPGNIIRVSDLPKEFKKNISHSLHLEGISDNAKLYETLDMVERAMIERALADLPQCAVPCRRTAGNRKKRPESENQEIWDQTVKL